MRDPNRYGFSPDELQRLFGRTGAYEGDAWMERGGKKAEAPQGSGKRGFRWFGLGTNTIDQTDNLHEIIRQHAQPDADKLHSVSPTRANFRDVQPSHWNINKIRHITFTADRPHGFGHGRAGKVEVLNDTQVRIHR